MYAALCWQPASDQAQTEGDPEAWLKLATAQNSSM
jgi:hypothetical protein